MVTMPAKPAPILVVDDQRDVCDALRLLLKSEGYEAVSVHAPGDAVEAVTATQFAAAFIDLNYSRDTTSGGEGLMLLSQVKQLDADLPVIVMTAWGTVELAVAALRSGAGDFIEKPWNNVRLISVLHNQMLLGATTRQARRLGAENVLLRSEGADDFIAHSDSMRPVLALIERVAPSAANVLILGENGTGKSVIASRIHALSPQRDRSFVIVNMGSIADGLFEAEMFGSVRGAYTDAKTDRIGRFELADGGTLFLDEVANLPLLQQPKLLRVLEEGEFERVGSSRTLRCGVRVISATNADLGAEVAAGRFRKDLLYRLNTVEIQLPPLRHRQADILPLAKDLLKRFVRRYLHGPMQLAPQAEQALCEYAWPGNLRELAHVIERAVLMSQGDTIQRDHLHLVGSSIIEPAQGHYGARTLAEVERTVIRAALERCDGNIQRAAGQLGLSRASLYRRLLKLGLRGED